MGHGNANELVRLSAPDAAVLGLTTNGGVLRMSRMLGKDDHVASSTILTYRLGELGVGPRVHAAWIESGVCAGASAAQIRANPLLAFESSRAKCTTEESSKLKLFLVAEPFMPLYQLLTLVNGSQSALRGAFFGFYPTIDSMTTVDLQYSVELPSFGFQAEGSALTLGLKNAFNEKPPKVNVDGGYDPFAHNPLGRVFYLRYLLSL